MRNETLHSVETPSSPAAKAPPASLPKQGLSAVFSKHSAILAPMEDVTDEVFRKICRRLGAELCVTEFVNVEGLLRGCGKARHKITLQADDRPTAIQIYGSDAERLAEAAAVAEQAQPVFIDINCGCWVPKIARRGAGAAWLRDPDAMVDMVDMIVRRVSLPVTVKTRIGVGGEQTMPIVELAKRLEGVGIQALTIHCRTAKMGHSGEADWSWAEKAQRNVSIPVIVNGDIKSAQDARRALDQTDCASVMVGRAAINHPWLFREIDALLREGRELPPPSVDERFAICRTHLRASVAMRGEPRGVYATRRHLGGYLRGLRGASALRTALFAHESLEGCLDVLDRFERQLRDETAQLQPST